MLEVQDIVKGLGKITRVSNTFAWIGDKRYKHNTLLKKGILYYRSPQTDVNWTNKKEVKAYYESFQLWEAQIRGGDTAKDGYQVYEVKDNMIFHDGEYYLPWRYDRKEVFEDGLIYGYLIKKKNSYWELPEKTKDTTTVNLFWVHTKLTKEFMDNHENKVKNKSTMNDVDYLKSLNTRYLDSNDLHMFKKKHVELFDHNIFPFSVGEDRKKVTFSIDKTFSDWKILITHRNRKGWIKIDNSYHGRMPFKYEYGLIVKVDPVFTNECGYYVSLDKSLTWDRKMLESLIPSIIEKWDLAIENNAKLWG